MNLKVNDIETPVGTLRIAALEDRLCAVGFVEQWAALLSGLEQRFGGVRLEPAPDPAGASHRINAYFAGDLHALDAVRVDPGGTAFQRKVWAALRTIPVGRTASYSEVARAIGHAAAVRAVGAANGSNPIAIVIPCHRVIRSNGALCGYGGGIHRKRWLLAHEHAAVAPCRMENAAQGPFANARPDAIAPAPQR